MEDTAKEAPPVAEGIFTMAKDAPPSLIGGYCPACDEYYFPRPKYCRKCLAGTEEREVGSEGTVYTYTVIRTKPPLGLPSPYGAGYVDLDNTNLRFYCLLDPQSVDRFTVGQRVRLAVAPLGHDGNGAPRLRPYFTPVDGESRKAKEK